MTTRTSTTLDRVRAAVVLSAKHFGVTGAQIRSRNKTQTISRARSFAYWLSRHGTEASYPEIAFIFKRDHTTVIHGVRRFEEAYRTGKDWAERAHNAWIMNVESIV